MVGGAIGMAFFAEGGIVDNPVLGMVGEAGTEAVMPIEKIDGIVASAMVKAKADMKSEPSQTLNISGGIHIGAGNNLNKRDVRDAIQQALADVAGKKGMGSRGVI